MRTLMTSELATAMETAQTPWGIGSYNEKNRQGSEPGYW